MLSTDRISFFLGVGAIVVTLGVGTCSTNARIDDVNAGVNRRIDDLNAAVKDDVEALDRKVDTVAETLGAIGRDVSFLAGRQAERDRATGR